MLARIAAFLLFAVYPIAAVALVVFAKKADRAHDVEAFNDLE